MSIPTIVLDRAHNSTVHNGILRIGCSAVGSDGQEAPSGTILISAGNAGPILAALVKMVQDLALQQQAQMAEMPVGQA